MRFYVNKSQVPDTILGISLTSLFVLSVAFRDVYFSGVFQKLSFFELVILAFGICTLWFNAYVLLRQRKQYILLWKYWKKTVGVSVFTAMAWLSYFFALTHIEPSVVNTLFSGIAPFTVVILARIQINGQIESVGRLERIAQIGVLFSLFYLCVISLQNLSGFEAQTFNLRLMSLSAALLSGVFITFASMYAKQLHKSEVSAEAVLAVRFSLLVIVSILFVLLTGTSSLFKLPINQISNLAIAASLLIVLPIYLVQWGLVLTPIMTFSIVSAFQPILLFVIQLFDERIEYSNYSLFGIILYILMTCLGALAHSLYKNKYKTS